ncbi:MAG: helix-turn-helix transcriptional regulator [Thaumarchaeota archaeon]|nr:helix-turn-helix transcriptional regulator [Nitrososphaerota archaeon]
MQTVLNGIHVEQEEKIEEILQIMADKYSRDLLRITQDSPKSAFKIAHETGMPISTAYRRIQKLQDVGVLRVSAEITLEGKKHFLYQSKIKAISSNMIGEFINIEIIPNPPSSHKWGV